MKLWWGAWQVDLKSVNRPTGINTARVWCCPPGAIGVMPVSSSTYGRRGEAANPGTRGSHAGTSVGQPNPLTPSGVLFGWFFIFSPTISPSLKQRFWSLFQFWKVLNKCINSYLPDCYSDDQNEVQRDDPHHPLASPASLHILLWIARKESVQLVFQRACVFFGNKNASGIRTTPQLDILW